MNVKEQLFELYSSKWENYCTEIKPIIENDSYLVKPTNPLLLNPDTEYENADIRVMIFGQETNDWEGIFNPYATSDKTINRLLDVYNGFYNLEGYKKHGGHFWNGFRLFKGILTEKYPNKKVSFLWNNIIKIGKANTMNCPPEYIYEVERNYFSVVCEEIEILKPHIVLFLTGPNYDKYIKDRLHLSEIVQFIQFDKKKIAKVELPNIDYGYRTYHPNYLYRQGKLAIEAYFATIVNEINV
jgi:hypothetical protein